MKFNCVTCPNQGEADSIQEIKLLKKRCPECIRKSLRRVSNKKRKADRRKANHAKNY